MEQKSKTIQWNGTAERINSCFRNENGKKLNRHAEAKHRKTYAKMELEDVNTQKCIMNLHATFETSQSHN